VCGDHEPWPTPQCPVGVFLWWGKDVTD